jgi:hypothetical protein
MIRREGEERHDRHRGRKRGSGIRRGAFLPVHAGAMARGEPLQRKVNAGFDEDKAREHMWIVRLMGITLLAFGAAILAIGLT